MKDYIKLSKVTGKLYLAMLAAALVCMLIDTIFVCVDKTNVHIGESIVNRINSEISEAKSKSADNTYTLPDYGLDFSNEISYKVSFGFGSGFGFYVAMAGIIFLLFVRHMLLPDIRSREFEMTFPVKRSSLIMHEYWFFFILIMGLSIIQGVIFGLYQTHYNKAWLRVSGKKVSGSFIGIPNERLFIYVAVYSIVLLLAFTWIYLWMTMSKNPLLGIVVAGLIWFVSNACMLPDLISELITYIFVGPYPLDYDSFGNILNYNADKFLDWQNMHYIIEQISNIIFNPHMIFDYIDDPIYYAMVANENGIGIRSDENIVMEGVSLVIMIMILVVMLLIGIIAIRVLSGRKQLTNGGRIFNFRFAEWLFAIYTAFIWFIFTTDLLSYYYRIFDDSAGLDNYYIVKIIVNLLVSCIVALMVKYLLNPLRSRQTHDYIVSKRRWFDGLKSMDINRVIVATIIGVIIAYAKIAMIFYYVSDIHNEVDDYYREHFFEFYLSDLDYYKSELAAYLLIVLIISKDYRYWVERKSNAREFFDTIPERRISKKMKSIFKDLIVVIIPVVYSGIYINYRITSLSVSNNISGKFISYGKEMTIIMIFYMLMMVGLLHFMEEMFTNGLMRPVGYIGVIIMIFAGISGAVKTFKHSYIDDDIYNILTMTAINDKYMGMIIFYLLTGIVLLSISVILSEKRDNSKNGFYFEFEKYMFALMISVSVFFMAQPYVVALWHRVLIFAACIIMFVLIVYFMTPKEYRAVVKKV